MIFNTLFSLLAVAVVATSSPLKPQQLEVITPHITSPTEAVSWAPDSNQTVTWETKSIPPAFKKNTGMLLLGYITQTYDIHGNPQISENLDIKNPLATGFMIGAGQVAIRIPKDTPRRDTYVIVLFGDSGNMSPKFKIAPK
ncbi:hypothetical protein C8R43DRAFT_1129907 [Mycena crocata]|nr:hypothetical protein C8R43DRAFT_1129907 [Mycena crocata]